MSKDDFYTPTDIDALREENIRLKRQLTDTRSIGQELRRDLHRVNQQLSDKDAQLSSKDRQLSELDKQLMQKTEDVERMVLWFEELRTEISTLLNSRQWRALHIVSELKRRLLRRPRTPTVRERSSAVVKKFHSWRISYTRSEILSGGQERLGSRRIRGGFGRSKGTSLGKPSISKKKLARVIRKKIGPVPERTDWPRVSIVVLNRDGLDHLRLLFSSLQDHTDYPDFEVVLVDNGSTDGSVGFAKSFGANFPIRVIENPGNTSFSAGNNQGVEAATGELLLFLNNDIEPFESGWLKELVNPIKSLQASAVGALLLYSGGDYQPAGGYAVQHRGVKFTRRNLGEARAFNLGNGDDFLDEHLGTDTICPAATAACLLVERLAFDSVGGFTERYIYGQEDVDLGLKLTASGREILSSGRAVLFHHEYGTQNVEGRDFMLINMLGNQRLLLERWGPQLHRELLLDRLDSAAFWSNGPAHMAITVTSEDAADGYDDWYTAHELGEALERRGWRVTYVQRQGWYSLQADIDYLLVLHDSYDVSRVPFVSTIAWIGYRVDRWVQQPWFERFDVVLAPSDTSARMVEQSTGETAHFFPMATNPERFSRTLPNLMYEADYVFTGDYYRGETSELADHLDVDPEETFIIFGRGWEKVPRLTRYARGHLPYDQLSRVYSSAKLLIDDADRSTPCEAVNSRVFDALATGTLVVTNCETGVRELFDEDFPVYGTRQELRENLDLLLSDEARRAELAGRYREIVRREHTYERRAGQLTELLRERAESLSFCIKADASNWNVAQSWSDLHYARAVRRQLERRGYPCLVQVLDEWDNLKGLKYDVVIHLKGPTPYVPKPSQFNVLWNISHPGLMTARECERYDLVFVASERQAARLRPETNTPVAVLERATDPEVFFPDPDPIHRCELVFVGDSHKVRRRILRDLLPTDRDLVVWGEGWEGLIDDKHIVGGYLPNDQVRKAYSSASIVLIDHWDDMREHGFVSNQIYDALACGALGISDDLPKLSERFGDAVVTYDSPEDLHRLIDHYLDSPGEREEKGQRGRKLVLAHHTFEHRVEELLQRVEEHVEEGKFRMRVRPLTRAT